MMSTMSLSITREGVVVAVVKEEEEEEEEEEEASVAKLSPAWLDDDDDDFCASSTRTNKNPLANNPTQHSFKHPRLPKTRRTTMKFVLSPPPPPPPPPREDEVLLRAFISSFLSSSFLKCCVRINVVCPNGSTQQLLEKKDFQTLNQIFFT
jgi:hypothetical protein